MLLDRCTEAGITITVADGVLHVDAPDVSEVDELLRELKDHKAAVLEALTPSQNSHDSQNRAPQSIRDINDPRPDLSDDSQLWGYLLRHAGLADDADAPTGAYGALHGVRCCGARLEWQQNASLRIVPGAEYLGAWEDDRQTWLLSHRDAIAGWLDAIAHVEGEVHARRTRRVERQAA